LIQLPEGLKPEAPRLAKVIEKSGALPIVSADPCHGACDLATADAEALGADLIIHYGHAKSLKHERIPTVYVEARAALNINDAVEQALPMLQKWKRIGLTTTVQHVQTLDAVRERLLHAGKTVEIGDARRLSYAGQVIGCDYSNARSVANDVEAFLFVGGGQFHAIGVALSTAKPTVVADPYEGRAYSLNASADRVLKKRWALIELAKKAKVFAVLVGLKPGQKRLDEALEIKRKLEENGRNVSFFAAKEILPEVLMEFPTVEVYVNTACPRLSLDDVARFRKPLLSINEVLVVIGELTWEELCRRGLFED
jgi:2-(3-amino-3-carboxypropyl)histidine synthase